MGPLIDTLLTFELAQVVKVQQFLCDNNIQDGICSLPTSSAWGKLELKAFDLLCGASTITPNRNDLFDPQSCNGALSLFGDKFWKSFSILSSASSAISQVIPLLAMLASSCSTAKYAARDGEPSVSSERQFNKVYTFIYYLAIGWYFEQVLVGCLKWVLRSDRPYWLSTNMVRQLSCSSGSGTPSGHVFVSSFIWHALAIEVCTHPLVIERSARFRNWVKFGLFSLAETFMVLVLLSRVFMGQHFVHQCIIGWMMGISCSLIHHQVTRSSFIPDENNKIPYRIFRVMILALVTLLIIFSVVDVFGSRGPNYTLDKAREACKLFTEQSLEYDPLGGLFASSTYMLTLALLWGVYGPTCSSYDYLPHQRPITRKNKLALEAVRFFKRNYPSLKWSATTIGIIVVGFSFTMQLLVVFVGIYPLTNIFLAVLLQRLNILMPSRAAHIKNFLGAVTTAATTVLLLQ